MPRWSHRLAEKTVVWLNEEGNECPLLVSDNDSIDMPLNVGKSAKPTECKTRG